MKHLEELVQFTIDILNDSISENSVYGCDLHHEIFNTDYYIIGTYQAKKWLEENVGVFEAIDEIKEYEQFHFGEVNTDFSSPESVVNMYVYIKGNEILAESDHLNEEWDSYLNREDLDIIASELIELLEVV